MRLTNALFLMMIFAFLAACTTNSASEKQGQSATVEVPNASTETEIASTAEAIIAAIASADVNSGEILFNQVNQTGFACSSCHNSASSERLIGPGLFGIANQNLPTMPIEVYLWESIVNPSAFVVETYVDRVMPAVYQDIFTEDEIYQLIAYVMSLGN